MMVDELFLQKVSWWNVLNIVSSWNEFHRFWPFQLVKIIEAEFLPLQNVSSGIDE